MRGFAKINQPVSLTPSHIILFGVKTSLREFLQLHCPVFLMDHVDIKVQDQSCVIKNPLGKEEFLQGIWKACLK